MYNALGEVTVWDKEEGREGLIETGTHLYQSLVTTYSSSLDRVKVTRHILYAINM